MEGDCTDLSLEEHYGITFTGDWTHENKQAVFAAARLIGKKFTLLNDAGTAAQTFKKIFGGAIFKWVDGACGEQGDRCYADAYQFPPAIRFYSSHWTRQQNENGVEFGEPFKLGNPPVSVALVIHELGHAFDSQTGGLFNQAVAAKGITNKTGFGTIKGADGQTEVTADLFTNWVLGTFTGPGRNGVNLPQFMDENISTWLNIASTP